VKNGHITSRRWEWNEVSTKIKAATHVFCHKLRNNCGTSTAVNASVQRVGESVLNT